MYTQEIHSEVVNDNYHSVYVIIISEQPLKAKLITTAHLFFVWLP